jgi:hypothetical protein
VPAATEPPRITVLDGLVFIDEVALLAVLAISGLSIDAGIVARIALAIVLVVGASLVWGRWLAPRATHPLPHPQRLAAKLVVFAVAAGAFAATGHGIGAIVFFVASAVVVGASERERHRLAS